MKKPRIISVGRRDYPRELWGPVDFEDERLEQARVAQPLPHAPAGPGDLKFSMFEPPVLGGTRSRAIDALLDRHLSRRRR